MSFVPEGSLAGREGIESRLKRPQTGEETLGIDISNGEAPDDIADVMPVEKPYALGRPVDADQRLELGGTA
jgi:hypothetical protein